MPFQFYAYKGESGRHQKQSGTDVDPRSAVLDNVLTDLIISSKSHEVADNDLAQNQA